MRGALCVDKVVRGLGCVHLTLSLSFTHTYTQTHRYINHPMEDAFELNAKLFNKIFVLICYALSLPLFPRCS